MSRGRIADKLALAARPVAGTGPSIDLPGLCMSVLRQRPDLTARFDLDTPVGHADFVAWCLGDGRSDYRGFAELAEAGAFRGLYTPDPACPPVEPTPVNGLMRLVWRLRPDVQAVFPLPASAQDFVWWFFLHGARETGFDDLVGSRARDDVNHPVIPPDDPAVPPLTRLMVHLWRVRPDLQATFDMRQAEARVGFVRWFLTCGVGEHDLSWLLTDGQRAWLKAGAAAGGGDESAPAPVEYRSGVDLVGYTRGELGIGEDVRMLARACAAVRISNAAIDVRPDPSVRQADRRLERKLVTHPVHGAVVFAMTGIETVRVGAIRGLAELRGRYVIGHWPWELPAWPAEWDGAYDLVDEIWTISRYSRDAFAARAPVPVLVMPPAVELPKDYGRWRRSDFALPEAAFLFHFSFDFLSYPHRKNPWACIEAFRRAFPSPAEPVGLVVKTMRADRRSAAWRRLRRMAEDDPRIVLLDRTMDRAETIGLMAVSDAYVSLHRAEGFGRGLAEAMLLGRPVIATDHSGSTDFVSAETGFPVACRIVPVRPGQYPGGAGQHWADPDLDHAAAQMRRVYEDRQGTASVAEVGRRRAESMFAPKAAGRRYRARLSALGLLDEPSAGR